ncbi:MAG: adenylate/guanylate cyclase domain-containing protein [Actinomycetota bacterium]|nr:adenylate/guanylate cyclase domain-containing protein [Actinomycetota bacterium]
MSILFVDLVGFTAFAEGRDTEEIRENLNRYFELATEVITHHGGVVEKFIGDAVMAVWGAPTAHEDDAERCVRAALELIDALGVLGAGITARAGVLTGETAVTIGAINQGMVAGDIVNTASRLQSVAEPGTVLVGESTMRAASLGIAFEPAGVQMLKGKVTPVPAWRAVRVVAEVGGRGRTDMLEAPFVGRDEDLRLLKDLFYATEREGRIRLVSITGIGGIGKSRLTWEFEKFIDGLAQTVWWHHGRSPAHGAGGGLWALGEMVRGRAHLAESDDVPTTRTKVAEMLDRMQFSDADRQWIEAALLSLLGIDSGIAADQLFGAWRTFFEQLARRGPVVMIFEDLHWADRATVDFIDHLLEWCRTVPIYIVTQARPELLDQYPDWGSGRKSFTSLYLEPLSETSMRELLKGLIPDLAEPAVTSIIGRAEGVPLYAVEIVRMLLANNQLVREDNGTYAPVGDVAESSIPETLTALIASRLDGLDTSNRSLVMDAAVLGHSFTLAGLSVVSGIDQFNLQARLRSLIQREIFAYDSDPRSPEQGQYTFVQGLVREVAYNTLAHRDRKSRHLAAAAYFETLDSDEITAAVAVHYLAAHTNASDAAEAQALVTTARVALSTAAERAAALGGFDQALGFYDRALAITTGTAERADLLERSGNAASSAGHYQVALSNLREAIDLWRSLGETRRILSASLSTATALSFSGAPDEAATLLEATISEFPDLVAEPEGVVVTTELAYTYFTSGRLRRTIEIADQALEVAERFSLARPMARALQIKGGALTYVGRQIEGIGIIEIGKSIAQDNDFDLEVLRALNFLASVESVRNPQRAVANAHEGLTLARRLGSRMMIIWLLDSVAVAVVRTGDWSWMLGELEAMLNEEAEPIHRAILQTGICRFLSLRGDSLEDRLDDIDALTANDPQLHAGYLDVRAATALALGRLAEARNDSYASLEELAIFGPIELARAARASLWASDAGAASADLERLVSSGLHGPSVEADRMTIEAGLAALEGRTQESLALYQSALQKWRDIDLPWDEALTAIDMATLLGPGEADVRMAAATGREILMRLGAMPFLERLDAIMGVVDDSARSLG